MPTIKEILERTANGKISVAEAERLLRVLAVEEIGELAKIDAGRELRKGVPEIVFAEGKEPKDLKEIALRILTEKGRVIISRWSEEQIETIRSNLSPDILLEVHEKARMIVIKNRKFAVRKTGGKVGIMTAGTSDIPVAEEARVLVEEMGCVTVKAYDLGVAGVHRLLPPLKKMIIEDVDVIIVVAGREGALPSVVAGIVDVPVIAVPTSNSYGFGEKGISALMAMLQSCSLGIAVVNIDSGISAGAIAVLIANRVAKFKPRRKLHS
ncbi:MAG: nickel pincer cofactor biosynthesis protein LarB [Nitrososphaeria archaeon]